MNPWLSPSPLEWVLKFRCCMLVEGMLRGSFWQISGGRHTQFSLKRDFLSPWFLCRRSCFLSKRSAKIRAVIIALNDLGSGMITKCRVLCNRATRSSSFCGSRSVNRIELIILRKTLLQNLAISRDYDWWVLGNCVCGTCRQWRSFCQIFLIKRRAERKCFFQIYNFTIELIYVFLQ